MANCPGMTKKTILSENTKDSLSVVVINPTAGFFGYPEARCKLVNGTECVVKHLDLKNAKTQVLVSGYLDSSFSLAMRSLVTPYLARGRNVILLELFPILVRSYPVAARLTKPLGDLLGVFLTALTKYGLASNKLEIVGASLGAHISSFAAVKYHQLTGRKPLRLTGLDPAGPCYRDLPPAARLNAQVAHKVDVLHTSIDGFGIAEPLGHIDFYANGGEYQPSMVGNFIMPCFLLCSHIRAAKYWVLANIFPDKFIAVQCDSVARARHGDCYDKNITNLLGPKTDFKKPGIYYLPTQEVPPFYLGEDGIKKKKYGVNTYLLKPAPNKDLII
ncbi:lipase member I isoform X2 [Manduca sexta]|nr:lipase member I isoform X2 [Manduca sexta]